jgi:hypothetical protein
VVRSRTRLCASLTPPTGSHTVDYQLLDESDRAVLEEIAQALGFRRITDTELEVTDA